MKLPGGFLLCMLATDVMAEPRLAVEWDRVYGHQDHACGVESALAAPNGVLWVVCSGHHYGEGRTIRTLFRIAEGTGELKSAEELRLVLPAGHGARDASQILAVAGDRISLLTGTVSGGKVQSAEGIFLTPLSASTGSPGTSLRVVPPGTWLRQVLTAEDGNLLIVTDQSPLSVIKAAPDARVLWVRTFGDRYVLPKVAALPGGGWCVASQETSSQALRLMRLDTEGRVVGQARFPAAQVAVAAGTGQGCALMYTPEFESVQRRFIGFDGGFKRQWEAAMPFRNQRGQAFHVQQWKDGYLAWGPDEPIETLLVRLSSTGAVIWSERLPGELRTLELGKEFAYAFGGVTARKNGAIRVRKVRVPD